jgi:LmbE family N-acetylglucosaminyl deacetylase
LFIPLRDFPNLFRRTHIAAICLLATGLLVCVIAAEPSSPDAIPELNLSIGPTTRLLVLAPHPDDEALGAVGLIQRVVAGGGSVRVVLMTSGDAFPEGVEAATHIRRPKPRDYRNYGSLRERETVTAMQRLGLNRSNILFLGFPDGGLCLIASKYLSAKARAFDSPYTKRDEPPSYEQVIPGVQYRGADVRREIKHIIAAYRPTLVALPHAEDDHPEHCSTYIFARDALDAVEARHRGISPRILHYLVHYEQWPLSLAGDPVSALQPPPDFPPSEGNWRTLTLTPVEARIKQQAIGDYASQLLVIGRFMQAFGRTNELFLEGRPASAPECWCDATNVATELPPEQYRRRPTRRR